MPVGTSYAISPEGEVTATNGAVMAPKPPTFLHEAVMAHLRQVFAELIARIQPVFGTVQSESGAKLLVRLDNATTPVLVPKTAGRRYPSGTRVVLIPGEHNQYLVMGGLIDSTFDSGVIGTADIAAGAITSALLGPKIVTGANIADATITGANIASRTITGARLVTGTITGSEIASNTLTGGHLQARTITGGLSGKIAQATITGGEIASGTVSSDHLTSGVWSVIDAARDDANDALDAISDLQSQINTLSGRITTAQATATAAQNKANTVDNRLTEHDGPPDHHWTNRDNDHPKTIPLGHSH